MRIRETQKTWEHKEERRERERKGRMGAVVFEGRMREQLRKGE